MLKPVWSDAMLQRLKELHGTMRAKQIAAQLSREFDKSLTKNSVLGCLNRMGLSKPTAHLRRARAENPPKNAARLERLVRVRRRLLSEIDDRLIPLEQRLQLAELRRNHCRWPIGDPRTSDFFFCGGRAEHEKPYCHEHMKRSSPRKLA